MQSSRMPHRPVLIINDGDLPDTARQLAQHLAGCGRVFERSGKAVVLSADGSAVQNLTAERVVVLAHDVCRPIRTSKNGEIEVTLPNRVAYLWLASDEKQLRPIAGITTAPLLSPNGEIRTREGYDAATGFYRFAAPKIDVPEYPTRADAEAALLMLRTNLRTFAFADADSPAASANELVYTNLTDPPALDESAALVATLTACCRQSLPLAPALLVSAPHLSGSGSGKGLLVRTICQIAYGLTPSVIARGDSQRELDQRIASEMMAAAPVVFLDNVNDHVLRSEILAQILTEPRLRSRKLGGNHMAELRNTAFVAVTGNALSLAEDLLRRFIVCCLDPRCEDPERREFPDEIVTRAIEARGRLLTASLTIWRWGRHNDSAMLRGCTIGSFEQWARWCRDPLLALGCRDPIERMRAAKVNDPVRLELSELFDAWYAAHGNIPVKFIDLADPVKRLLHPAVRQSRVSRLHQLLGARWNGSVLIKQAPVGRWGKAHYTLAQTGADGAPGPQAS